MNMQKKKKKTKVRLRTILFLALAMSCNSFAWFVYNSKVSNSISASVKAWHVAFENEDNELIEYVEFKIDDIYPGMTNYENYISITNDGELSAEIKYDVEELTILGETFANPTYTSEQLLNMAKNDYPFKIEFSTTNESILPGGKETFNVKVSWPFESQDDNLDTLWGKRSYEYKKNNPNLSGIIIKIKLYVTQIKNDN